MEHGTSCLLVKQRNKEEAKFVFARNVTMASHMLYKCSSEEKPLANYIKLALCTYTQPHTHFWVQITHFPQGTTTVLECF